MPETKPLAYENLPHGEGLPAPAYAHGGDAGFDVRAAIPSDELLELGPFDRAAIPTGLRFSIPEGYELQVRSRSGLTLNAGLVVLNAPGTIDAGYTGELKVILANLSGESVTVVRGDRIAQVVMKPVTKAELVKVESVDEGERGDAGFGSTGVA